MMVSESSESTLLPWSISIVALVATATLGYMLYDAKSESASFKDRIVNLEAEVTGLKEDKQKLAPTLVPEQKQTLLENLKPLLNVDNEDLRSKAVEMTALVEPKGADLLLDQVLRTDPSVKVKLIALDVIGKEKLAYGRAEALKLLESPDPALRRKAAWCLGAIGKDANEDANKKVCDGLLAALRSENQAWVKDLIAHAERTKKSQPKNETVKGAPEAEPLTIPAYGSHGPYIQALGDLGYKEIAKSLQFFLESKDPLVRRETVLALGKIGSDSSASALIMCFAVSPKGR